MSEICVEWDSPNGPELLAGDVQLIDDGPFKGVVLLREPAHSSELRPTRAIDPYDDMCRRSIDHFQQAADKGVIYRGDAERHNPQYRQAMADWWRKVAAWIEEQP